MQPESEVPGITMAEIDQGLDDIWGGQEVDFERDMTAL